MTKELDEFVRHRAGYVCEYCRLPQDVHGWRFEIDHIIAEQHGGKTESENLALCCPRCNRQKGPNIAGVDPEMRQVVKLFNPRLDFWKDHFEYQDLHILGRTPNGRATVVVLGMNDAIRLAVRAALADEGTLIKERK